jgi:hypothetical protein
MGGGIGNCPDCPWLRSWANLKPGMPRIFVQNQQIWLQKSDFRTKMSKMLIFHYISYNFDKILHLKNQIWHWKIRFCQIWHLKVSTFLKNQQTWHPCLKHFQDSNGPKSPMSAYFLYVNEHSPRFVAKGLKVERDCYYNDNITFPDGWFSLGINQTG